VRPAAVATLAALAATGLAAGGCGDDGDRRLVVSAAASLTEPLRACAADVEDATVRLSFAGSDELAGQIRRGLRPDVYAAANVELPDRLAAEGLLEDPVAFATNRLAVAVPAGSEIDAVEDLAGDGLRVALGAEDVPVGRYARDALSRLGGATERAILGNVRTEEPDVKGVVGKVAQGAVDAGFVYASDVAAAGGRLRAVAVPPEIAPEAAYGAGVVREAPNRDAARAFVEGLVEGRCADALREAGFGPPPGR
jgi:molybdate transport system substrate-binding protein